MWSNFKPMKKLASGKLITISWKNDLKSLVKLFRILNTCGIGIVSVKDPSR